MARDVNFNFRSGSGSAIEVLHGKISIAPTRIWGNGTVTVLTAPTILGIANGMAVLEDAEPSPSGPTPLWAYQVIIKDSVSGKSWTYLVGIPDGTTPIDFDRLPEYTTTVPDGITSEQLQDFAESTRANAERAEEAANRATAPTQQAIADALTDSTPAREAAVSIVESRTNGLAESDNKSFRVTRKLASASTPAHTFVVLSNATESKHTARHLTAFDSTQPMATERETPSSFYRRTAANVVMNASGWWVESGRRVGLVIKDGLLIQDWEPEPQQDWGVEAFVFWEDGHASIEDRSTPGVSLIAAGAWNSVCFGKSALRGGVDQGLRDNPKYQGITGGQGIGRLGDGRVAILTVPGKSGVSGGTIGQFIDAAISYGFTDLYMLDGGGSAQLWINGQPVVPSSDTGGERPVPDALCFHAPSATPTPIDSEWQNLTLQNGAMKAGAGDENKFRVRLINGEEEVTVRVGFTGIANAQKPFTLPLEVAPKYIRPGIVASNAGALAYLNVGTDGSTTIFGTGFDATKVARGEFRFIR